MNPLLTDGVHLLRVYHDGKACEILTVTVHGSQVSIHGDRWVGEGVVTATGSYIGIAYLKGPVWGRAFHVMNWWENQGHLTGCAYYATGSLDELAWHPILPAAQARS